MTSVFNGLIGFGMVAIPVQLMRAMDDEQPRLHYIHGACGSRIRYQKVCPVCGIEPAGDDVLTAAQAADGRYVPVRRPDPGPADRVIAIISFHTLSDIDPVYYRRAYWVKPGTGADKPYRLLAETLADRGRVGLSRLTLARRAALAVVRSFNGHTLMLHTLYYPQHLRREGESYGRVAASVSPRERELAASLVDGMVEPFVPEHFPDQAYAELAAQIGQNAPLPGPEPAASGEVLNLVEKLKESVAALSAAGHA